MGWRGLQAEDGGEDSSLRLLQHALSLVLPLLFFPPEAMSLAMLHFVGQVGVDLVSRNGPQRRRLRGGWLLACSLALLAQARLSLFSVSPWTAAGMVAMTTLAATAAIIAIEHSSLKLSDAAPCGLLAHSVWSSLVSWVHRRSARLPGAEPVSPPEGEKQRVLMAMAALAVAGFIYYIV